MDASLGQKSKALPSESTPLLINAQTDDGNQPSKAQSTSYRSIVLLLAVVLVLTQCGDQLAQSPQTRIAEAIICYQHYEVTDPSQLLADRATVGPGAIGGVTEKLCKIEAVQSQLSSLRGYQGFLDGGPSLLLALPFGWAADKYGRRPLLIIGVLSFVFRSVWMQTVFWFWQNFDIRWSWASSLHGLMAGSSPVVSALFFVMVSDVVPETDRSKVFLRLGGANLISTVFMPLLSAWLMEYTPWIPSIGGIVLQICAVLVALATPETLNYNQTQEDSASAPPEEPQASSPATSLLTSAKRATAFLWHDWRVLALTLSFTIHLAVADCAPLQLQYVSTRYTLTFSEATTILTLRAVANIFLLFVLLPLAANLLAVHWGLSTHRSDLWMSRASMASWAIGWFLFGLSPTLLTATVGMGITALGSGSYFLIRSFLTPLVPKHNVARLYSLISVVDTLGAMIGAPLLASLFNRGLKLGGYGVGLPFYYLGVTCFVITVVLCVVGIRKGEGEQEEEDGFVGREGE